jgi:hypothetical protein
VFIITDTNQITAANSFQLVNSISNSNFTHSNGRTAKATTSGYLKKKKKEKVVITTEEEFLKGY